MSNREFKVGDKCRIRQWDDMAAEFGRSVYFGIDTPKYLFIDEMKPLCGKPFTISSIQGAQYMSEEGTEFEGNNVGWAISSDMLEYDEPSFQPVSEEELSSLPGF